MAVLSSVPWGHAWGQEEETKNVDGRVLGGSEQAEAGPEEVEVQAEEALLDNRRCRGRRVVLAAKDVAEGPASLPECERGDTGFQIVQVHLFGSFSRRSLLYTSITVSCFFCQRKLRISSKYCIDGLSFN